MMCYSKMPSVTPPIVDSTSNCSSSVRDTGSCFDLYERTPSGISAPKQNLLERRPPIASIRGKVSKSFNVTPKIWRDCNLVVLCSYNMHECMN